MNTQQDGQPMGEQMMKTYDALYAQEKSQRFQNEGWIGLRYRLPKYLSYLFKLYGHHEKLSVLELGSGNGEMIDLMRKEKPNWSYTATEYSAAGAECIRKKGVPAYQMDACKLDFPDNSFDLVLCYDVMHHVHDPAAMASEMVRVSKKYFFLCEANGLSVLRKLNEMRASMKAFGENSYTPWTYRSFFPKDKIRFVKTKPFYVLVVPKCPEPLIPLNIAISEVGERIPGLNWQGFNVLIHGEKA